MHNSVYRNLFCLQVTWEHYPQGFHAMLNFYTEIQMASDALNYIAKWVRSNTEFDEFGY